MSLRTGPPPRQIRPRSLADRVPADVRAWLTPVRVMLLVALGGSLVFVLWGLIDRGPTQVPVLVSGLTIVGVVFSALAVAGAIQAYRAGRDGFGARAFFAALLGGIAAIVAFACFGASVVFALMWGAS